MTKLILIDGYRLNLAHLYKIMQVHMNEPTPAFISDVGFIKHTILIRNNLQNSDS